MPKTPKYTKYVLTIDRGDECVGKSRFFDYAIKAKTRDSAIAEAAIRAARFGSIYAYWVLLVQRDKKHPKDYHKVCVFQPNFYAGSIEDDPGRFIAVKHDDRYWDVPVFPV